jgi:hypothetical protein
VIAGDAEPGAAGWRPGDPKLTRIAIASTAVVLALLAAFLVWIAAADFSRNGSEAKVIGAALGLIGVVVVQAVTLIGLLLKRSVDDRTLSISRAAEARLTMDSNRNAALQREDRVVNRIRTVREFFEYLASPDHRQKESALVLIGELGDPNLAIRLSKIYLSEGGLGAIATLTESADEDLAQQAVAAWSAVTEQLRRSVVRVSVVSKSGRQASMTGFCMQSPGTVLTIGSEAAGTEFVDVEISRFDLRASPATVMWSKPELTLLRLQQDLDLQPIEIGNTARLRIADSLYIMSFLEGFESATQSRGKFSGQTENGDLAVTGFRTLDESVGSPVVDGTGALVGMHYERVSAALTHAKPVEALVEMLGVERWADDSERS